jgi:HKD family nuclease
MTLKKLLAKYQGKYRYVYTSNGEWNTTQPVMWQRITMLLKGGFSLMQYHLKGKIKR